jgi:hypothetical protein
MGADVLIVSIFLASAHAIGWAVLLLVRAWEFAAAQRGVILDEGRATITNQ